MTSACRQSHVLHQQSGSLGHCISMQAASVLSASRLLVSSARATHKNRCYSLACIAFVAAERCMAFMHGRDIVLRLKVMRGTVAACIY